MPSEIPSIIEIVVNSWLEFHREDVFSSLEGHQANESPLVGQFADRHEINATSKISLVKMAYDGSKPELVQAIPCLKKSCNQKIRTVKMVFLF